MDNSGMSGGKKPKIKKEKMCDPFFIYKPPTELPYNTDAGEIVAVLPYTFGPPKLVKIGTIQENPQMIQEGQGQGQEDQGQAVAAAAAGPASRPTPKGEAVMEPGGQALVGDETMCPVCQHPSMRLLRNLVQGKEAQDDQPAVATRCVGIPTCMNIRCMYISPHLRLLPMPRMTSYEVKRDEVLKKLENVDFKHPERDPTIMTMLKEGLELKEKVARGGPPLPVDKNAINFYKDMPPEQFETVLKKVFDGRVPDIP